MTGILASVNSLKEAEQVLAAEVDIIDLKQPSLGALGALNKELIEKIVKQIANRIPVSATVGDLPMHPELVFEAVKDIADAGVDYIKIGFFPGGNCSETLTKLTQLTTQGYHLIGVLFADANPDFKMVETLKNCAFSGVMLDTMDKQKGSLTTVMNKTVLNQFVTLAKSHDLLCGLAGSLRLSDIPELHSLQPDYLGFRSALCRQFNRTAELDSDAIKQIKNTFKGIQR